MSLFFDDFSPDQSAAMCFSIACGLPKDAGSGGGGGGGAMSLSPPGKRASSLAYGVPSQTVRARALDAAVLNCKPPGFSSPQAVAGAGAGIALDGVMMGEKFNNSALHNGLQLFLARLLRPVWFLPVVVLAGDGSGSKRSADGKTKGAGEVPVIRDLGALRAPLELLRASIRHAFPRAVCEDLAALAGKEARVAAAAAAAAASEAGQAEAQRTGRAPPSRIGAQQQQQQQQIQAHKPDTPQQRHQKALKREALEVHAAYRLASRAAEAVRMIGVLARCAREYPPGGATAAKIPWNSLAGAPLWQIVSGGDEHRKASSLLADLVGPRGGLPADARDAYARELAEGCPTFFSPGDQRAFEGVELLRRAGQAYRGGGVGGGRGGGAGILIVPAKGLRASEEECARQGAALLGEAAKEWRGERALGEDGQLSRACTALAELGRLEAVVDVCMTCAQNFEDPRQSSASSNSTSASFGGPSFFAGSDISGFGCGAATSFSVNAAGTLALSGGVYGRGGGTGAGGFMGQGGAGLGAAASAGVGRRGNGGGEAVQAWEEGVYQGGGVVSPGDREKARLECYGRVLDTVVGLLTRKPNTPVGLERGGVAGEGRRPEVDSLISRCLAYDAPRLHEMLFGVLEVGWTWFMGWLFWFVDWLIG